MKKITKNTQLKIAAAGSLTSLIGASGAQGAIVQSPIGVGGIAPPIDGAVFWDVDGDGAFDFGALSSSFSTIAVVAAAGGGMGLVGSLFLSRLSAGAVLSGGGAYSFSSVGYVVGYGSFVGDWSDGDSGYFGFFFTRNGGADTHYGWGEMTLAANPGVGSTFTIDDAWYNDTPDGPITVGATGGAVVPEPSTIATIGLGALALGAAGLRRWRKNKKQAA